MAVNTATYKHLVDLANDTATRLLKERDTLRAQLADAELHTKQVERGLDKATAQLAAIRAQEPVLVVEKEPDYWSGGHFHEGSKPHIKPTKVWCLPIGTQLFTHPMPAQDVKDAERYRWLREQHWSTDTVAVVLNPKQAVKLGYVCPYDSLLDETIDAAIAKGAK